MIPTAHAEQAPRARGDGCSLDFDGGPGMFGSRARSARRPAARCRWRVETFHALRERQTCEGVADPGHPRRGSTCSTGTATAAPTGLFPPPTPRAGLGDARRDGPVLQAASVLPAVPGRGGPRRRVPAGAVAPSPSIRGRAGPPSGCPASSDAAGGDAARSRWQQHYVDVFDQQPPLLPLPDLVDRRRDPPPRRGARSAQGALPGQPAPSSHGRAARLPAGGAGVRRAADRTSGSRCCRSTGAGLELLRLALDRVRHAVRRRAAGGLRAAAGAVAARTRRRPGRWPAPARRSSRSGWPATASPPSDPALPDGSAAMSVDVLLWGVLPYVVLAVLVGGTVWRYRYDQFGWTTRSSQLYESRLLRHRQPAVPLRHPRRARRARRSGWSIPKSLDRRAPGCPRRPTTSRRSCSAASPGSARSSASRILIYRRRTTGPVFMATTRNDKVMYVVLVAAIVAGLATTLLGAARRRGAQLPASPSRRGSGRCSCSSPTSPAMAPGRDSAFHVHVADRRCCCSRIWPFTRLVHAFTRAAALPVPPLRRLPPAAGRRRHARVPTGPPRLGADRLLSPPPAPGRRVSRGCGGPPRGGSRRCGRARRARRRSSPARTSAGRRRRRAR